MPSAGQQIAEAVNNVAQATDKTADTGSMGIRGMVLNNIGNIAAMAIIAGAFLYLQREQIVQAREDRTMFRDSVKAINDSADRRYEKSETTHGKAMEKMGITIERVVVSQESSTNEMKEAVKEMRDATRIISKVADKIIPPP